MNELINKIKIIIKIKKIVDKFENLSKERQEITTDILRQYVDSKIEIYDAYNLLTKNGLILKTKMVNPEIFSEYEESAEYEEIWKYYIRNKIPDLSKIKE